MREILFKGKRVDNGEWVEGYFAKGKRRLDEKEIFAIIPSDQHFCYPYEICDYIEVDYATVCQYTGLTDKNGKKIFEGDIINDIDYGIMRCMYLHGSFVWYKEDGFHIKCMNYIPVIEVIGNVYDNPDLLITLSTDSD